MPKSNENIQSSSFIASQSMFSSRVNNQDMAPAKADRGLALNSHGFLGQRVAATQVDAVKPNLERTHEIMDVATKTFEEILNALKDRSLKTQNGYTAAMMKSLAESLNAFESIAAPEQRSSCALSA